MFRLMLLPLTGFLAACSATLPVLSDRAQQVQVHRESTNLVEKCKRLDLITARAQGAYSLQIPSPVIAAQLNAESEAREITARLGGDTLVLLRPDIVGAPSSLSTVVTVQVNGVAFKCK
jgi:hypothetical protein